MGLGWSGRVRRATIGAGLIYFEIEDFLKEGVGDGADGGLNPSDVSVLVRHLLMMVQKGDKGAELHPIDGSVAAAALQKPEAVPSDAELLKYVSGMKRGTVRSGHRRPMGVQFTLRIMTTKSLYAIKTHPDVSRMLCNQGKSVWMATKTTKGGNPVRVGFLSGTAHPEFTDRDSLALALKDLGVTDMGEKSNENAKAKLIRGPVSASYANVKSRRRCHCGLG